MTTRRPFTGTTTPARFPPRNGPSSRAQSIVTKTDPTHEVIDPAPLPQSPPSLSSRPRRRASARFMLSHPLHILSLGFGSGLSPIAPGTAGTLFAWASFVALNRYLTVAEWAA